MPVRLAECGLRCLCAKYLWFLVASDSNSNQMPKLRLGGAHTLQVSLSGTVLPSWKKGCRELVLGVWEAHWLRALCVSKDFRMGTFWCQSARAQRSVSPLSPVNRQHLSFYLSVLSLLFFCLVFAATPQSFWFWR